MILWLVLLYLCDAVLRVVEDDLDLNHAMINSATGTSSVISFVESGLCPEI